MGIAPIQSSEKQKRLDLKDAFPIMLYPQPQVVPCNIGFIVRPLGATKP